MTIKDDFEWDEEGVRDTPRYRRLMEKVKMPHCEHFVPMDSDCPKCGSQEKEQVWNLYLKECPYSHIDVYRVLNIFEVHDHAIGHAVKKLLCAGKRGSKDKRQDIQEAINALERWKEMDWE